MCSKIKLFNGGILCYLHLHSFGSLWSYSLIDFYVRKYVNVLGQHEFARKEKGSV